MSASPDQGMQTLQYQDGRRCEDCDRVLEEFAGGMNYEMMDSSDIAPNHACLGCQRRVCDLCSIDRQGRVCLQCATGGHG